MGSQSQVTEVQHCHFVSATAALLSDICYLTSDTRHLLPFFFACCNSLFVKNSLLMNAGEKEQDGNSKGSLIVNFYGIIIIY